MSEFTLENGWLLDQDLSKSEVIDGNEVRLYRAGAILAYLDGDYGDSRLVAVNPIPVMNEIGKKIGFANVYVGNGRLLSNIIIDYSTPERLSSEMRDGVRYYPRVNGAVVVPTPNGNIIDFKNRFPKSIVVYSLVLSTERPSDTRLQPFGEPVFL